MLVQQRQKILLERSDFPKDTARLLTKTTMGSRQFWDTFAYSVLDVLFCSMVKLDFAMRDLGEEQVKDTIVEGLGHMREALGEILEYIPTEDHTQREYAREFLRITADVNSGQGHSLR